MTLSGLQNWVLWTKCWTSCKRCGSPLSCKDSNSKCSFDKKICTWTGCSERIISKLLNFVSWSLTLFPEAWLCFLLYTTGVKGPSPTSHNCIPTSFLSRHEKSRWHFLIFSTCCGGILRRQSRFFVFSFSTPKICYFPFRAKTVDNKSCAWVK